MPQAVLFVHEGVVGALKEVVHRDAVVIGEFDEGGLKKYFLLTFSKRVA